MKEFSIGENSKSGSPHLWYLGLNYHIKLSIFYPTVFEVDYVVFNEHHIKKFEATLKRFKGFMKDFMY